MAHPRAISDTPHTAAIFLDLLRRIQKVDPEFPIQYAICLTEISLDEGLSVTTLADRAGLALSTVSRIIGALSDYRQRGEPYGFIEVKVSPVERRRKELYMTPKGRATLKDFYAALENIA
jgi:DNA-binding MarR family transcriptional regulator